MVEATSPSNLMLRRNDSEEFIELDDGAEEVKNGGLNIVDDEQNIVEDIEEGEEELFNPQEIDFSEVERLRTKVATLESLMANGAS